MGPPCDATVGRLYKKIKAADADRRIYGYIPLMASCSNGQIGALNAESFCERVLRCAGHVLSKGNTLLDEEELEMLVILRMNRDFMEFMREHYNHLSHQDFKMTVVRQADKGDGDTGETGGEAAE